MGSEVVQNYKVVLLGNLGVGKTAIWKALVNETSGHSSSDISYSYQVQLASGDTVTLTVVDTGGAEKYDFFTNSKVRGANALVVVYAIDDTESFRKVHSWVQVAGPGFLSPGYKIYVIGNKVDCTNRQVSLQAQQSLLSVTVPMHPHEKVYQVGFETSANDNPAGIKTVFLRIAEDLHQSFKQYL